MRRTWLWWSSGKDSAWTLHELRNNPDVEVEAIITTVNRRSERVAMHAVRLSLLRAQASSTGLDLRIAEISHPCTNDEYEAAVQTEIEDAQASGVEFMAFGDLFLEDIKEYREKLLQGTGITPLFPLWERDTAALATTMIDSGLRAHVICIDPRVLSKEFAGRKFDSKFLADLPESVDPCGENGEFHTFASAGPMFRDPIGVEVVEIVERDGFVFADLAPYGYDSNQ
ncbi:MAG: adenine nucleotide alpha hydrolase [Gammaproteobacteria bacterium]|nr:adenine nucleotide alpha hydrolase [Gammaproteobacteria bacterium]